MQADLLIRSHSAGWTGWEILTVLDEWKMALVTVLVEVERVKMVVVYQSAGTVVHLDKDISCYVTLNRSQDTDTCVLVNIGQITGQTTGQIMGQTAGYSG